MQQSSENSALSEMGAAESGAIVAENTPIAPDLQSIINRWPDLSEAVKTDILMMVQQSNRTNGVSNA